MARRRKPTGGGRKRKKCTAKKLIRTFKNCRLIRVCVINHLRTENCKNLDLFNPFKMARLNSTKSCTEGNRPREIPLLKIHGTTSSRQPIENYPSGNRELSRRKCFLPFCFIGQNSSIQIFTRS